MEYDLCVNCGATRLSSSRHADLKQIQNFGYQGTSVEELLKKFPNGFSVAADGSISKVIMATPHIRAVALNFPAAPCRGGFLVVEMIEEE